MRLAELAAERDLDLNQIVARACVLASRFLHPLRDLTFEQEATISLL